MLTYKECEKAVSSFPIYPDKEYVWFAYKEGECKQFTSRTDALTFSENVEWSEVNKEEYERKRKLYYEDQEKVVNFWISELKKEFDVSDKIFDICYAEAYDRGHAYGYDSIAEHMIDMVGFAEEIREAYENELIDD